jgi:hypothetical protein
VIVAELFGDTGLPNHSQPGKAAATQLRTGIPKQLASRPRPTRSRSRSEFRNDQCGPSATAHSGSLLLEHQYADELLAIGIDAFGRHGHRPTRYDGATRSLIGPACLFAFIGQGIGRPLA